MHVSHGLAASISFHVMVLFPCHLNAACCVVRINKKLKKMLEINYTRTQWGIELKWKSRKYFSNIFVLLFSALLISVRSHSIRGCAAHQRPYCSTLSLSDANRELLLFSTLHYLNIYKKNTHISPCAPAKGSTVNAERCKNYLNTHSAQSSL